MKFKRVKIAQFQEQDCQLTLAEAIDEFYLLNAHLFAKPSPNNKWSELLVFHDVGHVFFGVNTTILDEAIGDYWTIFGTDLSIREYLDYANTPEARKLIKSIGLLGIIMSLVISLPSLFRVLIRTRKMYAKWPARDYQQYMDIPLRKIRQEFGLRILQYNE